ncbi:helix-turn-helix domain-containing protein [Nonomuraea sp. NPDC026600]|uniref:helix-turn-helix domain-containing protein n=1 Tax=Nonomuraea sp. NPDC026600 TaxID=3155363 RepID=UPI0033F6C478
MTELNPFSAPHQEYDVTHARRRPGRPTKLTPDLQGRLITLLGAGYSAAQAAHEVNISPSTVYLWRRRHPAFSSAVDRARTEPRPAPAPVLRQLPTHIATPPAAPTPAMIREIIRQHPDGVIEIERHYADTAQAPAPAGPQAAPAAEPLGHANDHQEILASLQRIYPRSVARVQLDHLTTGRDRTLQVLRALEALHLVERQIHSNRTRWRATACPSH